MANHKSAVKAHRQQEARRARNRELRTRLRRALKSARAAADTVEGTATAETETRLRRTVSLIDTLVRKGVIHANAGARHKSRLAHRLHKPSAAA